VSKKVRGKRKGGTAIRYGMRKNSCEKGVFEHLDFALSIFEGLLTLAILIGLFRIIAGISPISLAFVAKSSRA
jgi:hypothetical protein